MGRRFKLACSAPCCFALAPRKCFPLDLRAEQAASPPLTWNVDSLLQTRLPFRGNPPTPAAVCEQLQEMLSLVKRLHLGIRCVRTQCGKRGG